MNMCTADVVQDDVVVSPVGPSVSRVQELNSETSGVRRESGGVNPICQEARTFFASW